MQSYRCCSKLRVVGKDYRTSTGVGHQIIQPISEHYESIRRKVPLHLTTRDASVLDANYVTTSIREHDWKTGEQNNNNKSANNQALVFMRSAKEKFHVTPPRPIGVGACGETEYKSCYPRKTAHVQLQQIDAVEPAYVCQTVALGREQQPAITFDNPSIVALLDPYVTTSQMSYIPYTRERQMGVAKKDIDTFYDIAAVPKCKGFGPKQCDFIGPQLSRTRANAYDEAQFKMVAKNRDVPTLVRRVPHSGMLSEHQSAYQQPLSSLSSLIWTSGVECVQPFPRASRWENEAAPHMYCTEYCHVGGGAGFPVRAAVDPAANRRTVKNTNFCNHCTSNIQRTATARKHAVKKTDGFTDVATRDAAQLMNVC